MHIGHYISGGGHAALISFVLLGGMFSPRPEPVSVAQVSVLSEAEFAALTARSQLPQSDVDVSAPPQPEADTAEPAPAPPVPEAAPEVPVAEVAPEPLPEPQAVPEPTQAESLPQVPPPPPPADVTDAPPVLETPAPEVVQVPVTSARPQPRPAPRVAPEPVAQPEPDVQIDEVVQDAVVPDAVVPDEAPSDAVPEPEQQATAPEAATTEIVTEADEPASAAPGASIRPRTRPERPLAPTAPQTPATRTVASSDAVDTARPATQSANAQDDGTAQAVADALAQVLGGSTTAPANDLPIGPPMTSGEKDVLRVAVQACWVVDIGSQAANVTVTVAMNMDRNGRVVNGSLRMLGSDGGSAASADTAFQAARRAILRCQKDGFQLPAEKYAQWREIEMTFNPEGMRVR